MRLAGFRVAHHFGIAVIGSDDERAASLLDRLRQAAETGVDSLDCLDRRIEAAGVSDHVGIRVVEHDDVETVSSDRLDDLVGNLGRRHFRLPVVGRHLGRRHENPLFAGEDRLPPAIEKERDVRVFLGLGDAQLRQPRSRYDFAEGVLEVCGREQRA